MNREYRIALRKMDQFYKEMEQFYHEVGLRIGLSDSAFLILYTIWELGEGCTQKDICDENFISKQTVHSSIRKLEREGILIMEKSGGRDRKIYLTEEGHGLIREKIEPVMQMEEGAFGELNLEEQQAILHTNRKYLNSLYRRGKEMGLLRSE